MTTQVTYQGIEYTVNDGETLDDLLRKEGFEEAHQNNVLQMTSELVAPTLEEQEMLKREEEKSGVGTALLQGLSNDQGYQTAWLAQQRFPELIQRGIDPVNFYFLDEDEDIAYVDPYSNEVVKEFKDNLLVDTARYAGPTAQFLGELGGGTAGLVGGAFLTGNPFGAALNQQAVHLELHQLGSPAKTARPRLKLFCETAAKRLMRRLLLPKNDLVLTLQEPKLKGL